MTKASICNSQTTLENGFLHLSSPAHHVRHSDIYHFTTHMKTSTALAKFRLERAPHMSQNLFWYVCRNTITHFDYRDIATTIGRFLIVCNFPGVNFVFPGLFLDFPGLFRTFQEGFQIPGLSRTFQDPYEPCEGIQAPSKEL